MTEGFQESDGHKNFAYDKLHQAQLKVSEKTWTRKGEKMALTLFGQAAKRVPAYKDFLRKNKINPRKIGTIQDFSQLPLVDKTNYFRRYPLASLCWDGLLQNNTILSVSSGSSGEPFFWPRSNGLELETALSHGNILKQIFRADRNSTLLLDSFSMGIYIAGVVIHNSALRFAEQGYPLIIATPGIDIIDTLRVIGHAGKYFNQIVIAGYPPFVKDIIDAGATEGIKWKQFNVKFLFAAENFSENFRANLLRKVGATDMLRSSVNIYGSAEASIMAHETPFTIMLRRMAHTNGACYKKLFGDSSYMPTLAQYNPSLKYFETVNNELILTSYAGIPLVRYNIHDTGRITKFSELRAVAKEYIPKNERTSIFSWQLPAVQVYGKSDLTISFYGLKIYPENIKTTLENREVLRWLTGKFAMFVKDRANGTKYWQINLEVKSKMPTASDKLKLKEAIVKALQRKNLEFRRLHSALGARALPELVYWPKGDKNYFNVQTIKQRWTKKSIRTS